jgi:hypothetical protein
MQAAGGPGAILKETQNEAGKEDKTLAGKFSLQTARRVSQWQRGCHAAPRMARIRDPAWLHAHHVPPAFVSPAVLE